MTDKQGMSILEKVVLILLVVVFIVVPLLALLGEAFVNP
jgi:hypothetical protein